MPKLDPERQRRFAVDVVRKLREGGFLAYWAGGCVRDQLLGRLPVDYDVATDARPPEIRTLFGRRRTVPVGAAFGVITVLGPRGAGQIEVATFRRDDSYSDGRRPDSVTFSSAEEDASRRDFTINGLFFDPIGDEVIDYVGGREDLDRRVIRAIGTPEERFEEDKLRLLRAVRFAAAFDFALEERTREAVCRMAREITVVSPERIAAEMRRMLPGENRARAVRLLLATGLAEAVLPEIVPSDDAGRERLDRSLDVLEVLPGPGFPLALAALLCRSVDAKGAAEIGRRWRLSNEERDRCTWLVEHHRSLAGAPSRPWSEVQKLLVHDGAEDLVTLTVAAAAVGWGDTVDAAWCRAQLQRPQNELDPPPLVTGEDLIRHGLKPGPQFRELLEQVRDAQLDGRIQTNAEALSLVDRLVER